MDGPWPKSRTNMRSLQTRVVTLHPCRIPIKGPGEKCLPCACSTWVKSQTHKMSPSKVFYTDRLSEGSQVLGPPGNGPEWPTLGGKWQVVCPIFSLKHAGLIATDTRHAHLEYYPSPTPSLNTFLSGGAFNLGTEVIWLPGTQYPTDLTLLLTLRVTLGEPQFLLK
jgi:hypothetical protein